MSEKQLVWSLVLNSNSMVRGCYDDDDVENGREKKRKRREGEGKEGMDKEEEEGDIAYRSEIQLFDTRTSILINSPLGPPASRRLSEMNAEWTDRRKKAWMDG